MDGAGKSDLELGEVMMSWLVVQKMARGVAADLEADQSQKP